MVNKVISNSLITGGFKDGSDGWGDPMNQNLAIINGILQPIVRYIIVNGRTADINSGVNYLILDSSVSTDSVNCIGITYNGDWLFVTPKEGYSVYCLEDRSVYRFTTGSWVKDISITDAVSPIKVSIADIYSQLSSINSSITAVNKSITDQGSRLDTNIGGLNTSLNNSVTDYNSKIKTVNDSVSALSSSLNTLSSTVTSNTNDISALKTKTDTTDNNVSSINSNISVISSKIDTLSNGVSTNTNSINTLGNNLTTVGNKTDSLRADLTTLSNKAILADSNGLVPSDKLPSYVDDVLEFDDTTKFPSTGESSKIYISKSDNTTYRWGGSNYVKITSGEVSSVNGYKGVVTLTKNDIGLSNIDNTKDSDKVVASAYKLTNGSKINGVGFDGSKDINISDDNKFIATGLTVSKDGVAPDWTVNSGLYSEAGGASNLVLQLRGDNGKSVPSLQLKASCANGGLYYRSARDDKGFEKPFERILTESYGVALSSSKLATARAINTVPFDGSQDITVYDSSKLPLTGGSLTGDLNISGKLQTSKEISGDSLTSVSGTIRSGDAYHYITLGNTYQNTMIFASWQPTFSFQDSSSKAEYAHIDTNGVTSPNFYGSLRGNSDTTSKLNTARNISLSGDVVGGMSFDGSSDTTISTNLVDRGITAKTYGSSTTIPSLTINSKGIITGASENPFTIVNDLTTGGTTSILSAEQGKILQDTKVNYVQTPSDQGSYIYWNKDMGQGRMDFINNRGLGSGGFDFWNGGNGLSFSKSASILYDGTYTGNASSSSKLQTSRKINGVSFDGTQDIVVPVPVTTFVGGEDLNSIASAGFYNCNSSDIASKINNKAIDYAFSLLVEAGATCKQTFTQYFSGRTFIRVLNADNSQWSVWKELAFVGDSTNSSSGSSSSTSRLSKAVNINGVAFDGSQDITIPNLALSCTGGYLETGGGDWVTSDFVTWLTSNGAFSTPGLWSCRLSWSYANNKVITDSGFGRLQLAGAVIEVYGYSDTYTIRVSSGPTSTEGTPTSVYTYYNYGSTYLPRWIQDFNSEGGTINGNVGIKGTLTTSGAIKSSRVDLVSSTANSSLLPSGLILNSSTDSNNCIISKDSINLQNSNSSVFSANSNGISTTKVTISDSSGSNVSTSSNVTVTSSDGNSSYLYTPYGCQIKGNGVTASLGQSGFQLQDSSSDSTTYNNYSVSFSKPDGTNTTYGNTSLSLTSSNGFNYNVDARSATHSSPDYTSSYVMTYSSLTFSTKFYTTILSPSGLNVGKNTIISDGLIKGANNLLPNSSTNSFIGNSSTPYTNIYGVSLILGNSNTQTTDTSDVSTNLSSNSLNPGSIFRATDTGSVFIRKVVGSSTKWFRTLSTDNTSSGVNFKLDGVKVSSNSFYTVSDTSLVTNGGSTVISFTGGMDKYDLIVSHYVSDTNKVTLKIYNPGPDVTLSGIIANIKVIQ